MGYVLRYMETFLKIGGIPKSHGVPIFKWSFMTWMIWCTPQVEFSPLVAVDAYDKLWTGLIPMFMVGLPNDGPGISRKKRKKSGRDQVSHRWDTSF